MLSNAMAKASQHNSGGKYNIYAIITNRGSSEILAEAGNSYVKTHPRQAEYARRTGNGAKIFLHAEIAALIRNRQKDADCIYIARVDGQGRPRNAAPCEVCCLALREANFKEVYFT